MHFVADLYEVAADPRACGWRDPGTRQPDDYGELVALTPDLRGRDIELGIPRHPDVRLSGATGRSVSRSWGKGWS